MGETLTQGYGGGHVDRALEGAGGLWDKQATAGTGRESRCREGYSIHLLAPFAVEQLAVCGNDALCANLQAGRYIPVCIKMCCRALQCPKTVREQLDQGAGVLIRVQGACAMFLPQWWVAAV